MKLILFDIDGTITYSNGNGKLALVKATESIFGTDINPNITMAGKTDTQIVHDMLIHTISKDEIIKNLANVFNKHINYLKEYFTIERGVGAYPGVAKLLEELSLIDNCVVGLLTGNIYHGAIVKLSSVSLEKYFRLGAFGDDGFYRSELPEIAVKRAFKELGYQFSGKDIVIIGDTVNDIECGRHLRVKSIAICSNKATERDLKNANPDYLFQNLENTTELIEAIFQ